MNCHRHVKLFIIYLCTRYCPLSWSAPIYRTWYWYPFVDGEDSGYADVIGRRSRVESVDDSSFHFSDARKNRQKLEV
jgi:hypothetical protein